MDTNYRERMSFRAVLILLAALACGFSIASILISDFFVAVSSACLTVLLLSERRGKKTFSLISVASIIGLNAIFFAVAHFTQIMTYNIAGVQTVFMTAVLYFMFKKNVGKGKTVLALFLSCVLFFALSLWLVSASYTDSFSFVTAVDFYKSLIVELRDGFVDSVASLADQLEGEAVAEMLAEEVVLGIANQFISMLPAIFLIAAIAITGLTCKIFTYTVYRTTGNTRIYEWKFVPNSILAYIYSILFVLYVVFSGKSGVFPLIVVNLAVVLMFVYAYFGFGFVTALLSVRHTRGFSWSIIIVAFIVAPPIALTVLSFFGVAFNVLYSKRQKMNF